MLIMIFTLYYPYVGQGPLHKPGIHQQCRGGWWTNLVYLNNLIPPHGVSHNMPCYGRICDAACQNEAFSKIKCSILINWHSIWYNLAAEKVSLYNMGNFASIGQPTGFVENK